jgi:hypothetical protein
LISFQQIDYKSSSQKYLNKKMTSFDLMNNEIKRPVDITILAILAIIAGVSLIIISFFMLLKTIESNGLELVYLLFAIFSFIIAYGFLTAKNWARILFILYLLVGIVYYLWENIEHPINIIITIIPTIIVIYILTRPHIKKYFLSQ